jgi:hypothetical protein
MKLKSLVALVACLNCILASVLLAQEPQMFRYQGRILDNDALVSGDLAFSFKLYDSPTGGSSLYEDAATITVVDGLYSTMIGDDTTSGGDLGDALNNPAVYLEIEVGGETLSPRERIVSVPYAMNGLPSGSVVLSASNPNAALVAKGYSLVYSDVSSVEDWAVALQSSLLIPFDEMDSYDYSDGLVTFGGYVGFLSEEEGLPEDLDPFFYSRDGVVWSESTPPFSLGMYGESVVLDGSLYILTRDMNGALLVATTANGADWSELSVSSPVSDIQLLYEIEAFADQIWLFGSSSVSGAFVLKSSDGATWAAVDSPSWDTYSLETESTPERLLVLAMISGGTDTYIWSTTDGASWTQSSAVIPDSGSPDGPELTFANGALWTLASAEGDAADAVLYKSTDWGDSWAQVTTNLPELDSYEIELENLGTAPGLLLSDNFMSNEATYITENGSDWSKIEAEGFDEIEVSAAGQIWIFDLGGPGMEDSRFHSIGGPLRNGRFFYYQKD